MNHWQQWGCALACALTTSMAIAMTAEAGAPATITVEGKAIEQIDSVKITPSEQTYSPTDTAEVLKTVPGANVNKNGPLTGIAQYRGMYGPRVNVQVDGLNVAPAGPNWMDPPLSHLAPAQLKSIKVIRGISPVAAGAESIGGTITTRKVSIPFSSSDKVETHSNISTGYESNNRAYTLGGQWGVSSQHDRLQVQGNLDKGHNMKAGNGLNIVPTQYQRSTFGLDYGHQLSDAVLNLGYGHEEVGNSGSPALPMDIIYVKGSTFSAGYQSNDDAIGTKWLADFHYMDTNHLMNNYSLRKFPVMLGMMSTPMKRYASTNAKDFAYKIKAAIPVDKGKLTIGTDGWMVKHQADVFDPNNPAFLLKNYNNITRNRYSLFSQWNTSIREDLGMQIGVRYTQVTMNAGQVAAQGFGGVTATLINQLASRFNRSQLSKKDHLFDVTLQLSQRINDHLTVKIGGARKQRAPSYQERYLWSPLESTSGLADMRTYVGDVNLKPETAYNLDAGFDWKSNRAYFTPRVFYKRVKNYIQGTPLTSGTAYNFRVAQGNMLRGGNFCSNNPTDPFCVPLQFSNTEAEFYGADAGFGINMTDRIALDGTVSYVRGKRKDIVDNLYRIAPLNGNLNLSYYGNAWSVSLQSILYGKQRYVSVSNSEQKTSAYSLFNLQGRYEISRHIALSAGVNNIFNHFYQNHLSGYNRVSQDANGQPSAVAQGIRMPGEGRSFFVQAKTSF